MAKISEVLGGAAAIAKGMSVTFREMMNPTLTEDYPEAPAKFQERYRGVHELQRDEWPQEHRLRLERNGDTEPRHHRERAVGDCGRDGHQAGCGPKGVALSEPRCIDCDAGQHQQPKRSFESIFAGVSQQLPERSREAKRARNRQRLDQADLRDKRGKRADQRQQIKIRRRVIRKWCSKSAYGAALQDVIEPWKQEVLHVAGDAGPQERVERESEQDEQHRPKRPLRRSGA